MPYEAQREKTTAAAERAKRSRKNAEIAKKVLAFCVSLLYNPNSLLFEKERLYRRKTTDVTAPEPSDRRGPGGEGRDMGRRTAYGV